MANLPGLKTCCFLLGRVSVVLEAQLYRKSSWTHGRFSGGNFGGIHHDVITGRWTPSAADRAAGRLEGYGTVTNIINGGLECGRGQDARVADRIGFYKRYCDILGVGYGNNLDCYSQRPFGSSTLIDVI